MAILSKTKWAVGYYNASRQAIVLLDDGIWRVCRGKIQQGRAFSGETFCCVHDGTMYWLDNASFREIDTNTPEDEIYRLVCDYNMESLSRNIEIKKILRKHSETFRRNNPPAVVVDEMGIT